jgi:electron transport complex protein RnfG
MSAIRQSMQRSAIGLGLFAIITGGTIALTQGLTEHRIAEQAARAEAQALFEIIPEHQHDNNLLRDVASLPPSKRLAGDDPLLGWVARQDDQPVGLILPVVAPDGYSGDIRLLVGLDMQGNVLGVRVTAHRETPGLGDGIETRKSDWIRAFEGQSLGNPPVEAWTVKKNGGAFDQFTGATITPRAVVHAVRDTLLYFREHRDTILDRIRAPADPRNRPLTPDDSAGQSNPGEAY